jgi:hypothetical protein
MAKRPRREAANEIYVASVKVNLNGEIATDLVVFQDERCIEALQTSSETHVDGSFAKNTDHQ